MHTFHFLIKTKTADTNTTKPWYISTGLIDGVTNMIITCNTLMSALDIENMLVLYDHQLV